MIIKNNWNHPIPNLALTIHQWPEGWKYEGERANDNTNGDGVLSNDELMKGVSKLPELKYYGGGVQMKINSLFVIINSWVHIFLYFKFQYQYIIFLLSYIIYSL